MLAPCLVVAQSLYPGNEKSQALLAEGAVLERQGKAGDALSRYQAAMEADPKASLPISSIAGVYWQVGQSTKDQAKRTEYLGIAGAAARDALKLDAFNPVAMDILRRLDDDQPQVVHKPSPEAMKAMQAAEDFFHAKQYDKAIVQYEQAIKLDPNFAEAVIFLGDCYFFKEDYVRAEQYFRRATVLNPRSGQAWRFLFDTFWKQGRLKDAEGASISALQALPSEKPSWPRVARARKEAGEKMTEFRFVRRAKFDIKERRIDLLPGMSQVEMAIWIAHVGGVAKDMDDPKATPFSKELAGWTSAMTAMSELPEADRATVTDPALLDLLRFHQGGQLKPAILLLMYREAYRPEFEAWKKEAPDGIKRFIDTFKVGL